jgi:hypothetical protein
MKVLLNIFKNTLIDFQNTSIQKSKYMKIDPDGLSIPPVLDAPDASGY